MTSGRERGPGSPRRRAAVGVLLVLGVLAGGGAIRGRPDAHGATHPTTTGPPTPAAGGVAVVGAEPAPQVPVGVDLATTVSVGHVRSTAVDGDAHAALIEQALHRALIGAHFVLAPQPGSTAAAPKGVEVLFDRRLDDRAVGAFVTAVEGLPATTAFVTEEAGTAVDVSAPLLPGSGCEPAAAASAAPDPSRVASPSFAGWFPLFALTSDHGRVVLSYTGPARTPDQLTQTASFLARLCGVGVEDVRVARHERPSG